MKRKARKAFTIVEAIVALFLVSLFLNLAMEYFCSQSRLNSCSQAHSEALEASLVLEYHLTSDLRAIVVVAEEPALRLGDGGCSLALLRSSPDDGETEEVRYALDEGLVTRNGVPISPARAWSLFFDASRSGRDWLVCVNLDVVRQYGETTDVDQRDHCPSTFLVRVSTPEAFLVPTGEEGTRMVDGALEFANDQYVVGWACDAEGKSNVTLRLLVDGKVPAEIDEARLHRVFRADLFPCVTGTSRCGFAYHLPEGLLGGEHRVEVQARCPDAWDWTTLGARAVEADDSRPWGQAQLTGRRPNPFGPGEVLDLKVWAFDGDLSDEQGLAIEIHYEGQKVQTTSVLNFCAISGHNCLYSPAPVQALVQDVTDGATVEVFAVDEPTQERVLIAAWPLGGEIL